MQEDLKTEKKLIADPVLFGSFFVIMYLCFFHQESLWIDELYSWYFSNPDLEFEELFYTRMITDVHPPLYYSMLHLWGKIFGHSKEALRLFSFIPAILSFVFLFTVKFEWFSKKFTRLLICFIASSFLIFNFSMDARSYEWIFFFSLISSLFFLEMLNNILKNKKERTRNYFFLFISTYILSQLHIVSFLYAGTLIIILLFVSFLHSKRTTVIFALSLGLLSLSSMLFWGFLSLQALEENVGGSHWITLFVAPNQIVSFFGKLFSANIFLIAAISVAFIKKPALLLSTPTIKYSVYLILSFFTLIVLVSLHTPIIYDRYLITVAPPILVVAAMAYESLFDTGLSEKFKNLFRYSLVLSSIFMLALHTSQQKADWEGTADIVHAFPQCNNQEILAAPSLGNWLQSYYFTSEKPKFTEFSKENYSRVTANDCPILSWSVHTKIYRNDLAAFMTKNNLPDNNHTCVETNFAEVCFK